MEEAGDAPCVVYFCGYGLDQPCNLFTDDSPPPNASGHASAALDQVYRNVQALLDEDLGGFREGTRVG